MDQSIEQRYSNNLLKLIKTDYPSHYWAYGLNKAVYLGSGIDAHAYAVGDRVFKFTQNKQHAKVSAKLVNKSFKHLVKTYAVHYLPKFRLWCIQEERLSSLPDTVSDRLRSYSLTPKLQDQLDSIKMELAVLGVKNYECDCLSPHNLLRDSKTKLIKANDFGYTTTKYEKSWPVWA